MSNSRRSLRKRVAAIILLAGYASWVSGRIFDAAFADLTVYFMSLATSNDVWSIIYLPPKPSGPAGTPLWLHVPFAGMPLVIVLAIVWQSVRRLRRRSRRS
ncbi:hypothetical protein [Nonomuraea sp. NPDC050691]|uniref:hypothetical protein n=1 Tax=Nonomuraea sp. NPDC050691 TaxID=3155661 RepID=UPI00340A8DB9